MKCPLSKSSGSPEFSNRCISPAAVNQTETTIETNWASLIEDDVFKTFKYCRMSGNDIKRRARRNRRPDKKDKILFTPQMCQTIEWLEKVNYSYDLTCYINIDQTELMINDVRMNLWQHWK